MIVGINGESLCLMPCHCHVGILESKQILECYVGNIVSVIQPIDINFDSELVILCSNGGARVGESLF